MTDKAMVESLLHEALGQGVTLYLKNGALVYKARGGDLTKVLKAKIKALKPLIIKYLEAQKVLMVNTRSPLPPLTRLSERDQMPLSFAQQSLWLMDSLERGSSHYNLPATLALQGQLNKRAFCSAFERIVERHEILRTRFWHDEQGNLYQRAVEGLHPVIQEYNLSQLNSALREQRWQKLVEENNHYAFSLSREMVWLRICLVEFDEGDYRLLLNMPHIVADGWSMPILLRELQHYYRVYSKGDEGQAELPVLKQQYGDYAHWQNQWFQGEQNTSQENYWCNKLKDLPQVHQLPLDKPRPEQQRFVGESVALDLPVDLSLRLQQLAKQQQVTPFILLYTAFSLLLSRYSQERDIVVGSPIAGRNHSDTETLIGYFVNTLVLRTQLSDSLTENNGFTQLLQAAKKTVLDAYDHQHQPFERLVEKLNVPRSLSHQPVFQILFALQRESEKALVLPGLKLTQLSNQISSQEVAVKFDLELNIKESEDSFTCQWLFNTSVFERTSIERMATNFTTLLSSICETPDENIFSLNMLSEQECVLQQQLRESEGASDASVTLANLNPSVFSSSKGKTVHQLFEEQVLRTPENVAVVDSDCTLSYQQVNERANQLANYLLSQRVFPPSGDEHSPLVAVYTQRSHQLLIVILGVMKAGGAYLPLDPSHPPQRTAYILEDAKPALLLTDEHSLTVNEKFAEVLSGYSNGLNSLNMDELQETLKQQLVENPQCRTDDNRLAYVIYTSGSTGHPKGVLIAHQQWRNTLISSGQAVQFCKGQSLANLASQAFDISLFEQFLPLVSGGCCVVLSQGQVKALPELVKLTRDCHFLHGVPSLLKSWLEHLNLHRELDTYRNLQCILVGGDAVPAELLRALNRAFPECRIVELYGPTENAILSTYHTVDFTQPLKSHCIGKPLAHVHTLVMETPYHVAPLGVKGELWLGGGGVAQGYWQRDSLTAEKFIRYPSNKFCVEDESPSRIYKSGDWVRWQQDGNLLFSGRVDDQVKINGYRIELGEIELHLAQLPEVQEAVVIVGNDSCQRGVLSAFVVPNTADLSVITPANIDAKQTYCAYLKRSLRAHLPDYMVPGSIVPLAELPLTDNGKINRKHLHLLLAEFVGEEVKYTAPRNVLEARVLELFSQVFSEEAKREQSGGNTRNDEKKPTLPKVGIYHDFFELGGFSLLAMRLASLLQYEFKVDITLREVFENPNVAGLAEAVSVSTANKHPILEPQNWTSEQLRPVSYAQQRLWFIDQLEGVSHHYNMPGAVRLSGDLNKTALREALLSIVQRHEVLRSRFVKRAANEDPFQPEVSVAVQASIELPMREFDFSHLPNAEEKAQEFAQEMAVEPFDLSRAPLFNVALLTLKSASQNASKSACYLLVFNLHHIISDAWSMAILVREFSHQYQQALYRLDNLENRKNTDDKFKKENENSVLSKMPLQYSDYAHWQKECLTGNNLENLEKYWRQQLQDLPQQHSITLDKSRPLQASHSGGRYEQLLDASLTFEIKTFSASRQLTNFMFLHSVFALFIGRIGNTDDVVLGTPTAGREHKELEQMIGFFVNMLVLRSRVVGASTFEQFLEQNQRMIIDAFSHQQLPFELLVEAVQPQRDTRINPLFQIVFRLDNGEDSKVNIPNLNITPAYSKHSSTKVDLEVSVIERNGLFILRWVYNKDLWSDETIQRFSDAFEQLLLHVLESPTCLVNELNALTLAQREELLDAGRGVDALSNATTPMHQQFEILAEKHPERCAVNFADQQLSYGELNSKANRFARHLKDIGIETQDRVGIHLQNSLELHIALLAVMKLGATYIPLEPGYPQSRLQYIAEDSQMEFAITDSRLEQALKITGLDVLFVDRAGEDNTWLDEYEPHNLNLTLPLQNYAYILYTSGSTGHPKGVTVSYGNLANYLAHAQSQYVYREDRQFPEATLKKGTGITAGIVSSPLCFDATITTLFTPLCAGAAVVLLPQGDELLSELKHLLASKDVALLFKLTPAHLEALKNICVADASHVFSEQCHHIVVGGEAFSAALQEAWQQLLPNSIFVNEYGPTESTVGCTVFDYAEKNQMPTFGLDMPIGLPIAATQMYVVDNYGQLQVLGAAGELWIAGESLASGYQGKHDKTVECFVDNPFSEQHVRSYQKAYRSGDRVRWIPKQGITAGGTIGHDGYILEYLGRIDEQVKLRGYRIELDEIKYRLAAIDGITECAVVVKKGKSIAEDSLLAFVVAPEMNEESNSKSNIKLDVQKIRAQLVQQLPEYMLPNHIVWVPNIPLTVNGKVDRKALLSHRFDSGNEMVERNNVTPRNSEEEKLLALFVQVLGGGEICVFDDFFDSGGHSLLAMRLISLIRQQFDVELELRLLFNNANVAALAEILPTLSPIVGLGLDIECVSERSALPLSFAQQRLWFIHQLENGSQQYQMPSAYRLSGVLNKTALQRALKDIVQRHEALRARFGERNGKPYQYFLDDFTLPYREVDLRNKSTVKREQSLNKWCEQDIETPFDLEADLLLRITLLHMEADEHVLLINMHHIVSDGWSRVIFFRELTQLYDAYCQKGTLKPLVVNGPSGKQPLLPELSIQYGDFAHWQRKWLKGPALELSLQYWREQLQGVPATHHLPLDKPRPATQSFVGQRHYQTLPRELTQCIKDLCRERQATLFMGLYSVFTLLLSRYSGEQDVVIGSPIAGRDHVDIEPLIGFFVNTLILRSNCSGDQSFDALLAANKQHILNAYTHQNVPFEMLVDNLQPPRSLAHSPLFQILLTLQNVDSPADEPIALYELQCEPLERRENTSIKFDLELSISEEKGTLILCWGFNSDLFLPNTIENMAENFQVLMQSVVEAPQRNITDLRWVSKRQCAQLINVPALFSSTPPLPKTSIGASNLHQIFEQWVGRRANAIAVNDNESSYTYREINEQANRLARVLIEQGVGRETLVAVCMERKANAVVAMLAVLKAGAAYMPLDPSHPQGRIECLLRDSGVKYLLCNSVELKRSVSSYTSTLNILLCLEELKQKLSSYSSENLNVFIQPEQLAYVIYTSGSTGNPKGVMVEHRQGVHLIDASGQLFDFNCDDVWSCFHSLAFDFSVWEIWGALCNGARLEIVSQDCAKTAEEFYQLLVKKRVTVLSQTPSAFGNLINEDALHSPDSLSLRYVVFGGEALNFNLLKTWCDRHGDETPQLINMYGITETTVHTTFHSITKVQLNQLERSVIGRPLPGVETFLLNNEHQLVPLGCHGEIYVAGAQVSRGYLNNPKQNRERFIDIALDVYDETDHNMAKKVRLYKSGDIARTQTDGTLEYLGRSDRQVKIRGYRIELGEIENQLLNLPRIKGCAVLVIEKQAGVGDRNVNVKNLMAYVEVDESVNTDTNENVDTLPSASQLTVDLQDQLKKILPSYMVPTRIICVEFIPLTSNGKVDSAALQALGEIDDRPIRNPTTPTERKLCEIYSRVLKVDGVSIDANYFELGGDSIVSIQIVSEARKNGLGLQVRDIFEHQTIFILAQALDAKNESGALSVVCAEQGAVTGEVTFSPIQHWFSELPLIEPNHWNQAIFLNINKTLSSSHLRLAFAEIVAQHDALRLRFDIFSRIQTHTDVDLGSLFSVVDLSEAKDEAIGRDNCCGESYEEESTKFKAELAQACNEVQQSLNLSEGPALRVLLVLTPETEMHNRLLVVAHHLIVDGVSWRILLEDFTSLLTLDTPEISSLPNKTSSFKAYIECLEGETHQSAVERERDYWQSIVSQSVQPFPFLVDGSIERASSVHASSIPSKSDSVRIELDEQSTENFLRHVHGAYRTEVNDLLLSALGIALAQWSEQDGDFRVLLEGHGREDIDPTIDLTRSVGWFTSLFPVIVSGQRNCDIARVIKTNKERLRKVPKKGAGYGVLRYMHGQGVGHNDLTLVDPHKIVFNYLGQVDTSFSGNDFFSLATESSGLSISAKNVPTHALEINGMLRDNILGFSFSYDTQRVGDASIRRLAEAFKQALENLIMHCLGKKVGGLTPSDVALANVDLKMLDQWFSPEVQRNIEDMYPLSSLQEGMLYHSLLAPEQGAYIEQLRCEIHQVINVDAFKKAWQALVQQHSILRTSIIHEGLDQPLQVVYDNVDGFFTFHSFVDSDSSEAEDKFQQLCIEEKHQGFDLTRAPLMRIKLIELTPTRFGFIWTHHHILLDGWSLQLAFKSLFEFYRLFSSVEMGNSSCVTTAPPDYYRDYIVHLLNRGEENDEEPRFWQTYLAGCEDAATNLPLKPIVQNGLTSENSFEVSEYLELEYCLSEGDSQTLQRFCQHQRLTLSTLLQAAWAVLMHRYNRQAEIMFGLVVSGRPAEIPNIESKLGLFINSQPIYVCFDENQSVIDWLTEFQKKQTQLRDHQHTALADIQSWLPDRQGKPLFETLVVYENYPVEEITGDSLLNIQALHWDEHTHYPLTLIASSGESFQMKLSYDANRFDAQAMMRLLGHMHHLLLQMVRECSNPLSKLSLVTVEEFRGISLYSNIDRNTNTNVSKQVLGNVDDKTLSQKSKYTNIQACFEAQADTYPYNIAVQCDEHKLTYQQLNAQANQLAYYLQSKGVTREKPVAIYLPRGVEMIVAVLGVLKAGGAYLPIDPLTPATRVEYVLNDASVMLLLSENSLACNLSESLPCVIAQISEVVKLSGETLEVNSVNSTINDVTNSTTRNPVNVSKEGDLAYVIYTSGSTGKPKGVMVEHQNVLRLFTQTEYNFSFNSDDVWSCFHSLAFDFSVWEIFGALLYGGKLVIVPQNVSRAPEEFYQLLLREGVTVLNQTPSAFSSLIAVDQSRQKLKESELALRYVIFGGEVLQFSALKPWFEHYPSQPELINMYGITELTVHVTAQQLTPELIACETRSLIGRPIGDLTLFTVDDQLRLLPRGVPGELVIAGPGLTRGYLHQPKLTEQKFVNAQQQLGQSRVYRTGDLVCWHNDGGLEYLGRIDDQVQIRGFRIELGEIEQRLLAIPYIQSCKVLVNEQQQLCAYLLFDKQVEKNVDFNGGLTQLQPSDTAPLRQKLMRYLPDYMVPGLYFMLKDMPLTANGKINIKTLADLGRKVKSSIFHGSATLEAQRPSNELEEKLLQLFGQVLGQEQDLGARLGVQHNFFEIGGHSLLAVRLMAKIKQQLGIKLPLTVLYQAPSVAELAELINSGKVFSTDFESLVRLHTPLRQSQQEPQYPAKIKKLMEEPNVLFMVAGAWGNVLCFYPLVQMLQSGDTELFGLQPPGLSGECEPLTSVPELASFYIEKMKLVQPNGPYQLLGYSFGAQVVFEMGRQLEAAGENLGGIVLLDSAVQSAAPEQDTTSVGSDNLSVLHQLTNIYGWSQELDDVEFTSLKEVDQQLCIHKLLMANGLSLSFQQTKAYLKVHHTQVHIAYKPENTIKAPVILYRAEQAHPSFSAYKNDLSLGWAKYCQKFRSLEVTGDHDSMLHAASIKHLGLNLRRYLSEESGADSSIATEEVTF